MEQQRAKKAGEGDKHGGWGSSMLRVLDKNMVNVHGKGKKDSPTEKRKDSKRLSRRSAEVRRRGEREKRPGSPGSNLGDFFKNKPIKRIIQSLMAIDDSSERMRMAALHGTPSVVMDSPPEVHKAHRFNIMGTEYKRFSDTYTKGKVLGAGGFGKVYEVVQKSTGRVFACKEVDKVHVFKKGMSRMLMEEVTVMRRLTQQDCKCKCILQLEDVFEDPKYMYMILELCCGGDVYATIFAQFNDKSFYSEADAASLMRRMCENVQFCHSCNVIHRDIKPENFLWSEEGGSGTLKLADFGVATVWDSSMPPLQDRCGTVPYMSPEMWKKLPHSTEPDVWALGVCLSILLVGHPPFDANCPEEMERKVCEEELDFTIFPFSFLSADVQDLLSKILQKDPRKRITIPEILTHPWVVEGGTAPTTSITGNVMKGLQQWFKLSELHRAFLKLVADAIMHVPYVEVMRKEFDACDKDGNGALSFKECKLLMKESALTVTDEQVEQFMAEFGLDRNGELSFEQFVMSAVNTKFAIDDEYKQTAFRLLDKDGDGFISYKSLSQAIEQTGEDFGDLQADLLALDIDGDGQISEEEFVFYWNNHLEVLEGKCEDEEAEDAVASLPHAALSRQGSLLVGVDSYVSAMSREKSRQQVVRALSRDASLHGASVLQ